VNIKRSKIPKTCATCLKDKKNTEGCALQKLVALTTKAMVRASAMVVLIRKEGNDKGR
jgi:hypothetical protein